MLRRVGGVGQVLGGVNTVGEVRTVKAAADDADTTHFCCFCKTVFFMLRK